MGGKKLFRAFFFRKTLAKINQCFHFEKYFSFSLAF